MTDSVAALGAAVDEVAGFEPLFVPTEQKRGLLRDLLALEARLAGVRLKVMAAAGDVAQAAGARDVSSWLIADRPVDPRTIRAQERLAHALETTWQATGQALVAGAVSLPQAQVIADGLEAVAEDLDAEQLVAAEVFLINEAKVLDPAGLRKAAAHLADVVDPAGAEEREAKRLADEEAFASRKASLTLRPQGDGTTRITGRLPDAVAGRLTGCLEAFAQPRKQATESEGKHVPYSRLLAHALGDLLERVDPARLPDHGGDATTMIVKLSLEQLRSDLGAAGFGYDDDTSISAAQARRLACQAHIIPIVLGAAGQVLDVGRASRLHTPVMRKAIRLRDRTCRAAGCGVKAQWCDVHHLVPWSKGGRTNINDGILLCTHHHHRIHDPGYDHQRHPDGTIRFTRRT